MRRMKRWLSIVLCLVMVLGLLPATALAAEPHWADSAVEALNGVYRTNVFSTAETSMTVDNAAEIASAVGWKTDKVTTDNQTLLTRGTACEVLADVFGLPVDESESAIAYLYNQNIINGKSENDLNKNDSVSQAEFAVLTYRVLNSVGGGKGSSVDVLKPGTDEYFAWMYLAARACVPFQSSQINKKMSEATFWVKGNQVLETNPGEDSGYEEKTREGILTYWKEKTSANGTPTYDGDKILLETATALIEDIGATQIFSDVQAGSGFYDGVMYLFDHGLVSGKGNGEFDPTGNLYRYELAALLARVDGYTLKDDEKNDPIGAYKEYASSKGYLTPPEGANVEWWGAPITLEHPENPDTAIVTREEAIKAIMMSRVSETDLGKVNTAVLNRFYDHSSVSDDAKSYVAYAVSIGLVQGSENATINPDGLVNCGTIGVLLYRTLIGVDATKMKDYEDNVSYAMEEGSAAQTFSLLATPLAEENKTLTLREDWRLTSNLDLKVPEGTTLTIQGNGHYIYEMGGELQNSGLGKVVFQNTILYPSGTSEECTTATSDQLMMKRQPHTVNIAETQNGIVTTIFSTAKMGETVSLTITSEQGYELDTLTVTAADGTTIAVTNNSFTMPASDVTVSATFKQADTTPTPALTLTATPTTLSGGGTVTLTVTGMTTENAVTVTCNNTAYHPTQGTNGIWTVTLPNETASYTFTAAAGGYTSASCTVYVTR